MNTEAMRACGIDPPRHIVADGKLQRPKIGGKHDIAYKLCLDGHPAGFFQHFKLGIKENWKLNGAPKDYTPEEKRAYAKQMAEKEEKRQRDEALKHHNASIEAAKLWASASPATEHPYLTKKRIAAHGARLLNSALVLPLYGADLRLMSLQFIQADGTKRLMKNGLKAGCFWWIGAKTDKLLLCEGYATGCTLFECTGLQTFIAFDAGNLIKVAEIMRAKRPKAEIVICADHDESGVGQAAAEEAALLIGGLVAMPPEPGTDFNDLFTKGLNNIGGGHHE